MFKAIFTVLFFVFGFSIIYYMLYVNLNKTMPLEVGVLSITTIQKESKVFQALNEYIKNDQKKTQENILIAEKKLREMQEDIQKTPDKQKGKVEKVKKFNMLKEQTQREANELKEKAQKKIRSILERIEKELDNALKSVISKKNISIVVNREIFDQRIVLYASNQLNITDEVKKKLDQKAETILQIP